MAPAGLIYEYGVKSTGSVPGNHLLWGRQASSKLMVTVTRSLIVVVGFHQSGDSVLRSGPPTITAIGLLRVACTRETLMQLSETLDKVILQYVTHC